MLLACWLNGVPLTALSVQERGFAYGDGLFSTVAVRQQQPALIALHWQRLRQGCQRLAIAVQDVSQWQQDFSRFCQQYANCTAKIVITRGEGGRGYLPDPALNANCYFYAYVPAAQNAQYQRGISTNFLSGRLGVSPLLAGLKHLNRLEQVLLRQELATTPFPEALVCNVRGDVVEGVFSNVFIVRQGSLKTPLVNESGVAGVMRQHLLNLANSANLAVAEQTLLPADFLTADEVFFCNSVYGIWPVKQIQGTILADNPVTQYLQQQLNYV